MHIAGEHLRRAQTVSGRVYLCKIVLLVPKVVAWLRGDIKIDTPKSTAWVGMHAEKLSVTISNIHIPSVKGVTAA